MSDLKASKYIPKNGESNMDAELRSENEAIEYSAIWHQAIEYNMFRDACVEVGMPKCHIVEMERICGHGDNVIAGQFESWQRAHGISGNISERSIDVLVDGLFDLANY